MTEKPKTNAETRRPSPLNELSEDATRELSEALNRLLADAFALYLKTKNFHWHMSGPLFRDYHLLLNEQADQIIAITDPIAESVRKIGGTTLRSVGHIARTQRIRDNDAEFVEPQDMLAELRDDNRRLTLIMRGVHSTCDEHHDVATASLLEVWIDEAERRSWFLHESTRPARTAERSEAVAPVAHSGSPAGRFAGAV
jgi:starvation-inducible DNA-binding protein